MKLHILFEADFENRSLERRASIGDVNSMTRVLRNKLRSRDINQEYINILAELGYEAAIPLKTNELGVASYSVGGHSAYYYYRDLLALMLNYIHPVDDFKNIALDVFRKSLPILLKEYPTPFFDNIESKISNLSYDSQFLTNLNQERQLAFAHNLSSESRNVFEVAEALMHVILANDPSRASVALAWCISEANKAGVSKEWIRERLVHYLLLRN